MNARRKSGDSIARGVRWSWVYLMASRGSSFIAVPILLDSLGTDLYGVWVIAGVLIGAQGLLDLGVGTALTRFAAVAGVRESRTEAIVVFRRAVVFYGLLSAAIAVPVFALSDELTRAIPGVSGDDLAAGARLFRYAAVAFALTNGVLVLDGLLRGLDRVAESYAVQSIGWIAYVPALVIASVATGAADAAGLAWLITFGLQLVLLAVMVNRAVSGMSRAASAPASVRSMLTLGAQWQVSTWADFATFQLPRLLGGFLLGSAGLVTIDLALRFGQFIVAPLLAVYPVVLPALTRVHQSRGVDAVGPAVHRWRERFGSVLVFATAAAAPLSVPMISLWTGRDFDVSDGLAAGFVLSGLAAWASTGFVTSALLAVGRVGPVVRYKATQLVTATLLTALGALLGELPLAVAIAAALSVPALVFHRSAATEFETSALASEASSATLLVGAILIAGCEVAVVIVALAWLPDLPALVVSLAVAGLLLVTLSRALIPVSWREVTRQTSRLRRVGGV